MLKEVYFKRIVCCMVKCSVVCTLLFSSSIAHEIQIIYLPVYFSHIVAFSQSVYSQFKLRWVSYCLIV